MVWVPTKEGWTLSLSVDQEDDDVIVWADDFLRITLVVTEGTALYTVRLDQRRRYDCLEGPDWVAVFFGRNPTLRTKIKGQRLWRDKQIVVQRYGRKPRGYMIVAR